MLGIEIINHMDADELRNHICIMQDADLAREQVVFAQDELIEILQRSYNAQNYKHNALISWQSRMSSLRRVEEELEQKYSEFMPRPVCNTKEETNHEEAEASGNCSMGYCGL